MHAQGFDCSRREAIINCSQTKVVAIILVLWSFLMQLLMQYRVQHDIGT